MGYPLSDARFSVTFNVVSTAFKVKIVWNTHSHNIDYKMHT